MNNFLEQQSQAASLPVKMDVPEEATAEVEAPVQQPGDKTPGGTKNAKQSKKGSQTKPTQEKKGSQAKPQQETQEKKEGAAKEKKESAADAGEEEPKQAAAAVAEETVDSSEMEEMDEDYLYNNWLYNAQHLLHCENMEI